MFGLEKIHVPRPNPSVESLDTGCGTVSSDFEIIVTASVLEIFVPYPAEVR